MSAGATELLEDANFVLGATTDGRGSGRRSGDKRYIDAAQWRAVMARGHGGLALRINLGQFGPGLGIVSRDHHCGRARLQVVLELAQRSPK